MSARTRIIYHRQRATQAQRGVEGAYRLGALWGDREPAPTVQAVYLRPYCTAQTRTGRPCRQRQTGTPTATGYVYSGRCPMHPEATP